MSAGNAPRLGWAALHVYANGLLCRTLAKNNDCTLQRRKRFFAAKAAPMRSPGYTPGRGRPFWKKV